MISKVHTDGAKEYEALRIEFGGEMVGKSFFQSHTAELSAVAERINQTMIDPTMSLLIQAGLPTCLWPFTL